MTVPATAMPTTDPVPRAVMSMPPPMCETSATPTLTTSPVASRLGRVAPRRVAWRLVTWIVRNAAPSQLTVENRCRITPAAAWIAPRASSTPDQRSRAPASPAATPASIARPMTAGVSACVAIHSTPQAMPPAIVGHCARAAQSR